MQPENVEQDEAAPRFPAVGIAASCLDNQTAEESGKFAAVRGAWPWWGQ